MSKALELLSLGENHAPIGVGERLRSRIAVENLRIDGAHRLPSVPVIGRHRRALSQQQADDLDGAGAAYVAGATLEGQPQHCHALSL